MASNVHLIKLCAWFFGFSRIPREDPEKVGLLLDEFMTRETDESGFARVSGDGKKFLTKSMSKEQFQRSRRNILFDTEQKNEKRDFYGLLFTSLDEFEQVMKRRHLLPRAYQDKYDEWVMKGRKDFTCPPPQKKAKKKRPKQSEDEANKSESRVTAEENVFSDPEAFFFAPESSLFQDLNNSSPEPPPSIPLFSNEHCLDVAEIICRTTSHETLEKGKFHQFQFRLSSGVVQTLGVDMLIDQAQDPVFVMEAIRNQNLGGLFFSVPYVGKNGDQMVHPVGFPKCFDMRMRLKKRLKSDDAAATAMMSL